MEWLEINLETTSDGVEIISGLLINIGVQGLIIEDDKDLQSFLNSPLKYWDYVDDELLNKNREQAFIKFYLTDNIYGRETLKIIEDNLKNFSRDDFGLDLGTLKLEINNVEDTDWLDSWKKFYKTFEIGEKIIIKPAWEQYDNKDNKIVFTIEPGHAFGTGLHQSTRLCIEAIENNLKRDDVILDLGCGTGILSIIAMMLGAKSALAVDIDANACETAAKNAQMNNVYNNYETLSGDILEDVELQTKVRNKKYNIVVINIVADVIISLLDFVKTVLANDGLLITSGIIDERTDDVLGAMEKHGFSAVRTDEKEGWSCIISKFSR